MATRDEVLKTLHAVIDPELGINVVDLGLIYAIDIDEHSITVTMTLTTPGCPLHESMSSAVLNVLRSVDPEKAIHVQLVWEPPWTPERLTEQARQMLGWN